MLRIILLFVFGIIALVGFVASSKLKKKDRDEDDIFLFKVASIVGTVALVITTVTGVFYTQSVGEVRIIKNFTGTVAGVSEDAGLHLKAPWQSTISYDTRNMMINFYGEADYNYNGGNAEGAALTVNDKTGVKASVDIQVEYSLNADAAKELYENYGTQTSFTEKFLSNDLRAVARSISGKYDTMTMLIDRAAFAKEVENTLRTKWAAKGITVEQVNVQAVNYDVAIVDAYSAAQAAEVAKEKALKQQEVALIEAETELKVAEIEAQKALVKAQGEAEANEAVAKSLSDLVVRNNYNDALKYAADKGCLVIGNGDIAIQH